MPSRPRHRFFALLLLSGLLILGQALEKARAQDFFHGGVSPQTTARAGIFAPGASNVLDAIVLNPASLAAIPGPSAETVLFAGLPTGSFSNSANHDSRMTLRPDIAPIGAIGAPIPRSRWSAGFGVTPDFVASVRWHYSDSPGTAGADYGSQSETSQILALRAAAGLAYAATPRLSLGGTIGVVYNENNLVAPYIFQQNPDLKGLKTLLALHVRGLGWGGSFGFTGNPTRKLALGAAWSSPVTVNSHGHAYGDLGAQFAALDLPFPTGFAYRARVRVKLPQSVLAGGRWQATSNLGLSLQGDFVNFRAAFSQLPIHLTGGSNADINALLGSSSIQDQVPLRWSDQYTARAAFDRSLGEHYHVAGGYARRSSLVPNGTLTPLTGPIMKNELATGIEYHRGPRQLAAAYAIDLSQSARVASSGLLAGEYSHSQLNVGTQALVLGLSLRLK